MGRQAAYLLAGLIVLMVLLGAAYMLQLSWEARAAMAVTIEPIDFSSIHPGSYIGEYRLGLTKYKVEVFVADRRIADVQILRNRRNRHAQLAEGVVQKVIARGNVNVDIVSGATTSSTGLLKAIEQALRDAPACPT